MSVKTNYEGHIQNIGWVGSSTDGNTLGTVGEELRLEAIKISLETDEDLGIEYEAQIQDIGWQETKRNGEIAGTTGESKRLEAIRIRLTGSAAELYDVWYHTHIQNKGWMDWCKDGDPSGTEAESLRMEAIQIVVLKKGLDLRVDVTESFEKREPVQEPTPQPVTTPTANGPYGTHFTDYDFECDCQKGYDIPDPCDGWPETEFGKNPNLNPDLIESANRLRDEINMPVIPTCGTRCLSCNSYWGGVPDSLHLEGNAFDCVVPGMDIVEAARIMYQVIGKAVRVYPDQGFMHVEESSLDGVYNQEQGCYIY